MLKLENAEFSEVPYKTLLKILNRLEEEGLLSTVSKGVYFIGEKPVDEELIFEEYRRQKGNVCRVSIIQ